MSTTTLVMILVFEFFGLVVALLFAKHLLVLVIINEREVGVIVKKFGPRLPAGQLIDYCTI